MYIKAALFGLGCVVILFFMFIIGIVIQVHRPAGQRSGVIIGAKLFSVYTFGSPIFWLSAAFVFALAVYGRLAR